MITYALIVFALVLILSDLPMDKVLGVVLLAALIYYAIT